MYIYNIYIYLWLYTYIHKHIHIQHIHIEIHLVKNIKYNIHIHGFITKGFLSIYNQRQ